MGSGVCICISISLLFAAVSYEQDKLVAAKV
jgi:hypothetical protein